MDVLMHACIVICLYKRGIATSTSGIFTMSDDMSTCGPSILNPVVFVVKIG